jgi:hypothetical protein
MRLGRHFDHRGADADARAGRHVVPAQIEIDIQLIARKGPAGRILRHERDRAGVHDVDLHVGMRRLPVGAARARAEPPRVADESLDEIELRFVEQLARVRARPAHDQLQLSSVLRRGPDHLEAGFELGGRQVGHEHVQLLMHRAISPPAASPSSASRSSRTSRRLR